jgi:hypothetical protein
MPVRDIVNDFDDLANDIAAPICAFASSSAVKSQSI